MIILRTGTEGYESVLAQTQTQQELVDGEILQKLNFIATQVQRNNFGALIFPLFRNFGYSRPRRALQPTVP